MFTIDIMHALHINLMKSFVSIFGALKKPFLYDLKKFPMLLKTKDIWSDRIMSVAAGSIVPLDMR